MTRQEEIKYLLHTFGIKQSWLAEKLGLNNQTLTYLLNDAPLIDDDLYNKVKDILDDYQFDLALFDEEEPKDTLDLFEEGKLQEIMGERIRILQKEIRYIKTSCRRDAYFSAAASAIYQR